MAPNTKPIGVIARLLHLSERRVQQLSRDGVISNAERGQYGHVRAARGQVVYLRASTRLRAPDDLRSQSRRPKAGKWKPGGFDRF